MHDHIWIIPFHVKKVIDRAARWIEGINVESTDKETILQQTKQSKTQKSSTKEISSSSKVYFTVTVSLPN